MLNNVKIYTILKYWIGIVSFIVFLTPGLAGAQTINWLSLQQAQAQAADNNKKVMIFAEAKWCGYCKKMNKRVFPKKSVVDSMSKYFYPVRLDIESSKKVIFNGKDITEKELALKFRAMRTPTTIFLDSQGKVIGTQPGFLPENIFDKLLAYVGRDLLSQLSFQEYLSKHGVEL